VDDRLLRCVTAWVTAWFDYYFLLLLCRRPSVPHALWLSTPPSRFHLVVIWLENYLSKWKNTLLVVAHDPGFLDEFVDSIVNYTQKQLFYYKGQFDDYLKQRDETARALKKKRDAQLKQIKQMETFINKNIQGGRQAKQAKSKQKDVARLKRELIPPWIKDKDLAFTFPAPPEIGLPILQVKNASFKYADHLPNVFTDIDIGFYLDSRVALVGPNGVGKSTLMKLMAGDLKETDGEVGELALSPLVTVFATRNSPALLLLAICSSDLDHISPTHSLGTLSAVFFLSSSSYLGFSLFPLLCVCFFFCFFFRLFATLG
jgi:ABC transporter